MTKKMTLKEFKEILNNSGVNFDIRGYEGILNLISIAADFQAEEYKQKGNTVLAELEKEKSDFIYNTLENRGYYTL